VQGGRHYAGPNWEHIDSSAVVGKAVGNAPGATPNDIPWLKLTVTSGRGTGILSGVTTVQRINTAGGKLEGECDKAGAYRNAPYSADYVFLRKSWRRATALELPMLFMVIERFKNQDPIPVYRRVRDPGIKFPDGLKYVGSWIEPNFDRCFQLMECDDLRLLQEWVLANNRDLGMTFEIVPVVPSKETREVVAPFLDEK
jgi:Protein of unknown function (DUF3455)/Protein of unknown function (DUF3303)